MLRKYAEVVSRFLEEERDRFGDEVDGKVLASGMSSEQAEQFYEAYEEQFSMWRETFPTTIRTSSLVAACSRFEVGLVDICKELEAHPKITSPVFWSQLSGSALERPAHYIRDNFGIHLSAHAAWSRINHYFSLRHCVVHAEGNVGLMQGKQARAVRAAASQLKRRGVSISEYDRLLIGPGFVEGVIDDMSELWSDLTEAFEQNEIIGPVFWP
jgi:hypothetical protein